MVNLLDIITRHQIYLEGVKNGFGLDFERNFAYNLKRELRKQFAVLDYDDLGDISKAKLNEFLASLVELNKILFGQYTDDIIKALYSFMVTDRELSEEIIKPEDTSLAFLLLNKSLWSKISNTPMGATGVNILPTLAAFASMSQRNLINLVRKGWINKDSKADVLNILAVEIDKLVKQNRSIVGTVLQHISSEVQHSIGAVFYDDYMWSSIIDSSTTDVCRDRNGNIYRYRQGPIPPAHVGCRSRIIPLDRGSDRVPPPSFEVWAASQPSAFLKDAFQGKVADKVFPPLTVKQFAGKAKYITSTA